MDYTPTLRRKLEFLTQLSNQQQIVLQIRVKGKEVSWQVQNEKVFYIWSWKWGIMIIFLFFFEKLFTKQDPEKKES